MGITTTNNLQRPEPQALAATVEALAARFGNRLITSQAVRDQHAHTTTWLAPQPPDAVVMAQETSDIQDVVRICAHHGVRRLRRQPGGGMGMLLAHGLRGDQPVAEPCRQRLNGALQRLRFRPRQIVRYRCRHSNFLPALEDRGKGYIRGQDRDRR